MRWVERIFERLTMRYGAKFADQWRDIDATALWQAWAEDLAGYTGPEIGRGMDACKARAWPPTLPEFMLLCRPLANAQGEWAEAREQMARRLRGASGDAWSRPQVYWAAVAVGNYDLQTWGWEQMRPRWENALALAKTDPVPAFVAPDRCLPAPGAQTVTRDDALRRTGAALARFGATKVLPEPGKGWALALLRREASGEYVAFVAQGAWRSALGFDESISPQDALARFPQQPERAAA